VGRVRVLYGDRPIHLEVPEENLLGVYGIEAPPQVDVDAMLEEALDDPIGSDRLEETRASKVLIVVNDSARLTPTPKMLDHILPRVKGDVRIIVATGTHRPPTEEEYRTLILGHHYDRLRGVTTHHDSRGSEFTDLGRTARGTPALINSEVFRSDLVVTLGSVEPHYFAGYTGGRKSIAPGLCAYECVEANHRMALLPEAALGRLRGNPLHEDLEEVVRRVAERVKIFSLNVAITGEGRAWAARSGDIFASFYSLVSEVESRYLVELPEEADIVVAVAPGEMGIDLYQSHKALEAAKPLVREGGIVILIAPCWDGIGPRNFYDLLAGKSREEIKEYVWKNYRLGYHKSAKIVELLDKAKVYAVTDLDPEVLERIGFIPFSDPQEALNEALAEVGGKVAILPEASLVVPRLRTKR